MPLLIGPQHRQIILMRSKDNPKRIKKNWDNGWERGFNKGYKQAVKDMQRAIHQYYRRGKGEKFFIK